MPLAGVLLLLTAWALSSCNPLPRNPDQVTIVADGERRTVETEATTVQELLNERRIRLDELDRVRPPETTQIRDGLVVTVTRVVETLETVTETLPFGREVARDASLPEGETRLLQAGRPGVREWVYRVTYEDGVEVERVLVKDSVTQPPQDEVVLVGTRPQVTTLPLTGTLAYLQHQDAYVVRNSTASRRRLSAFGDLDGQVFDLAPGGERLLFTRPVTEEFHFNALWVVNTVEADAEPLFTEIYDVLWAGWAPDGRTLGWTTAEATDRPPGWRGRNDLWTARLTDSGTPIFKEEVLEPEAGGGFGWWGTRYRWSPTGEMLAYARPEEVGVVDLEQRERRTLVTFPAYRTYSSWAWEPGLSWSPAGDFVATVLHTPAPGGGDPEESPLFDLWMIAATGAYSAELTTEVGMWSAPRFSPDGETLLYGRALIPDQSSVSDYRLCVADRDGSDSRCFYPPEGESGIEIPTWQWSPDSELLAFVYQGDLHLLREDDPSAIPITDEGGLLALDWR